MMINFINCRKIFILLAVLVLSTCAKDETSPHVSVLPVVEGAELHFRGFVTNDEEDLVSQIYNFSRKVIRHDTLDGHPVRVFLLNNREVFYYTDEHGTIWQYNTEDPASRIVSYNFSYNEPVQLSYWQILLKVDQGVGTEWSVSLDTTFNAIDLDGKTQHIHYTYYGKARYRGWTTAVIPEINNYMRVLDAHWYELNTTIVNETSGDTLFSSKGTAHQYFEPDLGSIKYTSDFIKSEIGKPTVSLHGTWELIKKDIPK